MAGQGPAKWSLSDYMVPFVNSDAERPYDREVARRNYLQALDRVCNVYSHKIKAMASEQFVSGQVSSALEELYTEWDLDQPVGLTQEKLEQLLFESDVVNKEDPIKRQMGHAPRLPEPSSQTAGFADDARMYFRAKCDLIYDRDFKAEHERLSNLLYDAFGDPAKPGELNRLQEETKTMQKTQMTQSLVEKGSHLLAKEAEAAAAAAHQAQAQYAALQRAGSGSALPSTSSSNERRGSAFLLNRQGSSSSITSNPQAPVNPGDPRFKGRAPGQQQQQQPRSRLNEDVSLDDIRPPTGRSGFNDLVGSRRGPGTGN